jgi:DNA modification methylase
MTNEDSDLAEKRVYTQFGSVEMERDGKTVYPDFQLDKNPGMSEVSERRIGYPLGQVPASGDLDYAYTREPELYPEMDFRSLANSLGDGRTIPNTTYLTHAIHKHPAIFIPHIPSYVIRQFTTEENEDGERPLVLDPFSGSGTTGLEAKIHGRDYLGIEINPLSRLVGEVSTSPIPPSLLQFVEDRFVDLLESTEKKLYEDYDVEFLDRTGKTHWFEEEAIRDLTRIRKVVNELHLEDIDIDSQLNDQEWGAFQDLPLDEDEMRSRVYRWLVLMVANTVFEVSNADPGVSKAYKSKKMREKISEGKHPPDVLSAHKRELSESRRKLTELWDDIYGTDRKTGSEQATLGGFSENGEDGNSLEENNAHHSQVDIRLDDAREFRVDEYLGEVDLAVTSPPYISAMNYYRGTKLRLFWIHDLLGEDEMFEAERLKKSIIGTTSVSMSGVEEDLPASLRSVWKGSDEEFEETRLPYLDESIEKIHATDYNSAEKRGYITWKFFAEDMLQALSRTYEHLKPGGYFFFLIGENTICEELIHSHKFVADIAQYLGKFEGSGGEIDEDDGFRLVGSMWDEITNRDLFQDRNHEGGVIECEWMVVLQKPRKD